MAKEPKTPAIDKPATPRKTRQKPTYYVVEHIDGKLVPQVTLTSARDFGAAVDKIQRPGKFSLMRYIETKELKQGLLTVGATFGGE